MFLIASLSDALVFLRRIYIGMRHLAMPSIYVANAASLSDAPFCIFRNFPPPHNPPPAICLRTPSCYLLRILLLPATYTLLFSAIRALLLPTTYTLLLPAMCALLLPTITRPLATCYGAPCCNLLHAFLPLLQHDAYAPSYYLLRFLLQPTTHPPATCCLHIHGYEVRFTHTYAHTHDHAHNHT